MHKLEEEFFSYHTIDQLYALVVDIESYPEFLPWCSAAHIASRSDLEIIADLVISFKVFTEKYTSKVTLTPPKNGKARVDVITISGPFEHMENHWKFETIGDKTKINFYVEFDFKSPLLDKLMGAFLSVAYHKMIEAFEARAKDLYD